MSTYVSDLSLLRFADVRSTPFLTNQGDEDEHVVERKINATPTDAVVFFDLRGKEYVGYSYAKPTIRKQLIRRNNGEYGERRFVLVAPLSNDFLDGVSHALEEEKLLMYAVEDPDDFGRAGSLVGAKSDALRETFTILLQRAPISTGDLATMLDTTPQNAKNRIDRLVDLGIVIRSKEVSRTGGYEWINRIE